jgi:iron complex transport system ATP-binding protein
LEKSTFETLVLTNTDPHIISVQKLSIGYGDHVLLKDLHFDIQEGSITSILGMNGTGKSSLLRTICGLQASLKGDICIHGKTLRDIPARELAKHISIVLTGRSEMVSSLFVYEILAMARAPYQHWLARDSDADKLIVNEAASTAGITHLLQRRLYTLSDGEMQLVSIARAIAQETPVIILDEPTSHLDILHKLEVFGLLRTLSRQGKTIILTSHEIDMALAVADFALLIGKNGTYTFGDKNTLIENSTPATFFSSPDLTFDTKSGRFNYTL